MMLQKKQKKNLQNIFLVGTANVDKYQLSECIRGVDYSEVVDDGKHKYYGILIKRDNVELVAHIFSSALIPYECISKDIIFLCISRNQNLQQEIANLDLSVLRGIDFSKTSICFMVVRGRGESFEWWSLKDAKCLLEQKLQEQNIPLISDNGYFWIDIFDRTAFDIGNNKYDCHKLFLNYVKIQTARYNIKAELIAYRDHVGRGWKSEHQKKALTIIDNLIKETDLLNNRSDFENFKQHIIDIDKREECFGHHDPYELRWFKTIMMWISTVLFCPLAIGYTFFGKAGMYWHQPEGASVREKINQDLQKVCECCVS